MTRLTDRQDTHVLVLGGGPDAERAVSLESSRAVAEALNAGGRCTAELEVIDAPDVASLREMVDRTQPKVIFPVLHGRFGEGGPLQRLMDQVGVAYVGAGASASRLAIDKVATKDVAQLLLQDPAFARAPIRVSISRTVDPADEAMPLELPFVVKPTFEGSTIGLHICKNESHWQAALAALRARPRPMMAEPFVPGEELTAGIIDRGHGLRAIPIIRIAAASGVYDYDAKYVREDTSYEVGPQLSEGLTGVLARFTETLAKRMGIRHLARADFVHDPVNGTVTFLEINTMPGFTSHSLVPMAARAIGLEMTELCESLVEAALRDAPRGIFGRSRAVAAAG